MFILQVWLRSKPKHGRYRYNGQVYTKSDEFLDAERNLYGIRYCLRTLFFVMGLFVCAMRDYAWFNSVIFSILQIILADIATLPLYYTKLSKIKKYK